MNLFEKMLAIENELATVGKNLSVDMGSGKSYKAVSERDVIDAVKPVEAKYGVYSYPESREVIHDEILETETKYGTKTTFFTRIKTVYRFVNVEKPEEFITTTTFAEGIDSGDKGSGKAMTYADKYALMKQYKISTGDDPDQEGSKDEHYAAKGTLATKEEKKNFMSVCKAMGVDPMELLAKIGWKEGEQTTKDQIGTALVMLQGMSKND